MTGPATPGQEGPSEAPPRLPDGWIVQWDGNSRKYYFVQISTGVSTWEIPTQPAPGVPTPGATPQANAEHPYGTPQDGTRGVEGGDGERGLGSFAVQQLMGGKKTSSSNSGVMGLASQFLGGSSSSSNHNSSSAQSSGAAGIVGALAGGLLGGKKTTPQHYGQQQGQQSYGGHSGGSGGMMSSLGNMFGGHPQGQQNQSYGYSNNSPSGGYSGQAPSATYQPGGAHSNYHSSATSTPQSSTPVYSQNLPQGHSYGNAQPNYNNGGQQDYSAPASAHQYGGSQGPTPHNAGGYGQEQHQYGGQHQSAGGYGGAAPSYGSQTQLPGGYGGPPPVSHESRPHGDNHGGHHPPPPGGGYGYGGQGQGPPASYPGGPPPHTGNLQQPGHHHFQGMHNKAHSGGLYGDGHPPQHGQQRW